jgi:hypothetical protein
MVFGKMIVLDVLIKLIVDMEPSEKLMWSLKILVFLYNLLINITTTISPKK